jgi:hypothetical protein
MRVWEPGVQHTVCEVRTSAWVGTGRVASKGVVQAPSDRAFTTLL